MATISKINGYDLKDNVTTFKTINGEAIKGSGDIVISGGDGHTHANKPTLDLIPTTNPLAVLSYTVVREW